MMVSPRCCQNVCTGQQPRRQDSAWSWFVCVSATFADGLHLSLSNCFAIMLPVLIQEFDETRGTAAWVGSIAYSMSYFTAPLSALCCVRFGCRKVAMLGAVICSLSLVISSFAQSLILLYFTYGVLFGIGGGFLHTSGLLHTSKYFYKRRSLATGIVAAGASIGTLIGPVFQVLIDSMGWRNSYRVIGALFSLVFVLVIISYDPNIKNEDSETSSYTTEGTNIEGVQTRRHRGNMCSNIDCSIWKIPAYTIAVVGITIEAVGVYVPLAHLVKHCKEQGLSAQKASTFFIYIGVTSFIGKIIAGRLCDYPQVSTLLVHQTAGLLIGASMLLIKLATDYTGFAIFAACYGLGNGIFITTMYLIFLNTVDPRRRPTALAYGEMINALSIAIGSPSAGVLADKMDSYIPSFNIFGGIVILGAIIPFLLCFKKKANTEGHRECIGLHLRDENEENYEIFEQITVV